ncbi:MAG: right-handed parallel beta-helix repeat-containing protein [Bacteroidota bacterium]
MKRYPYFPSILALLCFHAASCIQAQTNHQLEQATLEPNLSSSFMMPQLRYNNALAIQTTNKGQFLFQTEPAQRGYSSQQPVSLPEWATSAIQTSQLVCDQRIPMDSVFNGSIYIIDEPGSYYFTDNIAISGNNADGIRINVSHVTIDLNGYNLSGAMNARDGIVVGGGRKNIVIKNGTVSDWQRHGVNALSASESIFMDLIASNNGGDGIVARDNCLIHKCVAAGNGFDGLEVRNASIISNSAANDNGDNGIQTNEGALVINCTSYQNEVDGFALEAGCRIENCNAYQNGEYGIDLGLGGQVINCIANENRSNGIDLASSCIAINNAANRNGRCHLDGNGCSGLSDDGAGIRCFANAQIIDNTCNDNIMGIRISSTDAYASGNYVEGNRHAGLVATSSGSFIIRNRGVSNGFSPIQDLLNSSGNPTGNIVIDANSAFGPIINVSNAGNLLNVVGADHPYANFEY